MKEIIVAYEENEAGEMVAPMAVGELVRCKDCKNHETAYGRNHLASTTEVYCFRYDERHKNDWFCADGERGVADEVTVNL